MLKTLLRAFGIGERRRHPRSRGGEVRIEIGGEAVQVLDWSPGGFRAGGLASPPARGTLVRGAVRVGRSAGAFSAYVVAVFDDGSFGARYDEIDAQLFRALAEFKRG